MVNVGKIYQYMDPLGYELHLIMFTWDNFCCSSTFDVKVTLFFCFWKRAKDEVFFVLPLFQDLREL